jgi:hypothetical protein
MNDRATRHLLRPCRTDPHKDTSDQYQHESEFSVQAPGSDRARAEQNVEP